MDGGGRRGDGADPSDLAERLLAALAEVEPRVAAIHGSFHDDQVLVGTQGVTPLDLDSAAIGHPLFDVGEFFASFLTAAGEEAALLRWSSLPFRDLEPGCQDAVAGRVDFARARFADYRRSASSVITAS